MTAEGECLNPGKEFLLNQGLFFAENDIFSDGAQVIKQLFKYAYLRKKSCQITWHFKKIIVNLQTKIAYLRKKSK
jgi:hypothetical protein